MAGVYVKEMKMPKGCFECPLKHRGFNGSETVHYCYTIYKEVSDDGEIDADCQLVKVPDHGDLIDAHSLKIRLGQRFCLDNRRVMEIVRETVDTAKVVIPAERSEK